MTGQDKLFIQGTYNTLYNAITRPDRKFVVTHYFLDEWVPILGPSLAWLVVGLRQRCFWNNRHDWCIVDKGTLARETAMQERTIERSLRKPFSDWFVLDITHRYRYRTDLGKKVRDKNRYHLLLDEPLSPRHQIGLTTLLQTHLSSEGINQRNQTTPIDAAAHALQNVLAIPHLHDKISYQDKIDKHLQRRSILDILAELLDLNWATYAEDENLTQLSYLAAQLHNKIVRQNKIYVGWQYYRLNWLEQLGHSLAWLIIYLRRRCFWDETSGELRETCQVFKKDLAVALGQTTRNLGNLFDNPHLSLFFTETELPDDKNPAATRRRGPTTYRVRLVDEPLIPQDQERVGEELRRQLQGEDFGSDLEHGQLNLFPMIDSASNRQNFAYGQTEENLPFRNQKNDRLDALQESLPAEVLQKNRRLDESIDENLSGWWQEQSMDNPTKSEDMPLRTDPSLVAPSLETENLPLRNTSEQDLYEDVPDRWEKNRRLDGKLNKLLSDSQVNISRLDDKKPEKMSQQVDIDKRKNVATLKDSLILLNINKDQEQQKPSKHAVAQWLDEWQIQEPTRSRILNDVSITENILKAWHLYTQTQPNLRQPESYVLKRLLSHDTPPAEFLIFAELNQPTWDLFEQAAQALYFRQPMVTPIPADLHAIFIQWAKVYRHLDPEAVRLFLAQQTFQIEPTTAQAGVSNTSETTQAEQLWTLALDYLQLKMARAAFDTWLSQTVGMAFEDDELLVAVPSRYVQEWLEHRLSSTIQQALVSVSGRAIQVRFEVQAEDYRRAG